MFLTEVDSRAKIKGSRDPLGLVPLWGHFGREVVGNLTTVSNSVSGFKTLLLGYYFSQAVQERAGGGGEDRIKLFLKFEQLAAYSRARAGDTANIRGIDRVNKNLTEHTKVRISATQGDQILSNQKVYGLWGLFSTPARSSSLVERDEPILTKEARRFTEDAYIRRLGPEVTRAIVELVRARSVEFHLDGRHRTIREAISGLFVRPTAAEQQFFEEYLLAGGPNDVTEGRQRTLANLMRDLPPQRPFDRWALRELVRKCGRRTSGTSGPLAERLRKIDAIESVLVAASTAFRFLLARNGQTVSGVAREIRNSWKPAFAFINTAAIERLRLDINSGCGDPTLTDSWMGIAGSLASGDFEKLLRHLLACNERVTTNRNGSSPWVRCGPTGKLEVRFRDEAGILAERSVLADAWQNNYFLDPLKAVLDELRGTK